MDNLSFHKSNDTKQRMDELGFYYAYTPIYSPKYNGIEEVIGIGKQLIKEKRLELIMRREYIDLLTVISDCLHNIDTHKAAKCIARSL